MKKLPILYVFVNTDLPSMNPGKAQAHSGHAANAFVYKHYIVAYAAPDRKVDDRVYAWMAETPFGFGTQINLKGNWSDVVRTAASVEEDRKGYCEIITDPTYPYIVDDEILRLIDPKMHSVAPKDIGNGRWVCHRSENTAAYIFGYKDDLEPYLGHYPLHP